MSYKCILLDPHSLSLNASMFLSWLLWLWMQVRVYNDLYRFDVAKQRWSKVSNPSG